MKDIHVSLRWLPVGVLCLGLSGRMAAQATGNHSQPKAAHAAPGQSLEGKANAAQGAPHDDTYVIGATDVLSINVWKEPEISRLVTVRSDGRISLPLVGELQASGETPKQLEQEIGKKLTSYISEPEVTVIVQESKSQRINILGQVMKPGSYILTGSMTVLDAIALAGGFRDFAKQKSIYVLRKNQDGTQSKMPFNYKDVIKGKNTNQNIKLEAGDTIVIP